MAAQPATRNQAPHRAPAPDRPPAPRRAPAPRSRDAPAQAQPSRIEARRRRRHLQRLRRDLLMDFGGALVLTIALVIITAGLGVIALLEVPAAGAVIASFILERRRRRGPRRGREPRHERGPRRRQERGPRSRRGPGAAL